MDFGLFPRSKQVGLPNDFWSSLCFGLIQNLFISHYFSVYSFSVLDQQTDEVQSEFLFFSSGFRILPVEIMLCRPIPNYFDFKTGSNQPKCQHLPRANLWIFLPSVRAKHTNNRAIFIIFFESRLTFTLSLMDFPAKD